MQDGKRDLGAAFRRGLAGRCPNCGEGRMFDGYLAVAERCPQCGEPLGEYRAADGPAFFAISIVGLLLVPVLGFAFVALRPDPVTLVLIVSVASVILTLVLLRFIKGAFIGFLWAHDERDRGS